MRLTYTIVFEELMSAKTLQELVDASQLINFVPDVDDDRLFLDVLVKERMEQLTNNLIGNRKGVKHGKR